MPWSTAIGVCIGVLAALATPAMVGPVRNLYDDLFPVTRMRGELVEREPGAVVLRITGEKLRGNECRLLAVYGYSVLPDDSLADADASRIDAPAAPRLRNAGSYNLGLWRVAPVAADATGVRVVAQYDCVGRIVLSVIADTDL
jgi:hypothetical protein